MSDATNSLGHLLNARASAGAAAVTAWAAFERCPAVDLHAKRALWNGHREAQRKLAIADADVVAAESAIAGGEPHNGDALRARVHEAGPLPTSLLACSGPLSTPSKSALTLAKEAREGRSAPALGDELAAATARIRELKEALRDVIRDVHNADWKARAALAGKE